MKISKALTFAALSSGVANLAAGAPVVGSNSTTGNSTFQASNGTQPAVVLDPPAPTCQKVGHPPKIVVPEVLTSLVAAAAGGLAGGALAGNCGAGPYGLVGGAVILGGGVAGIWEGFANSKRC
jgi:hypothetical protein